VLWLLHQLRSTDRWVFEKQHAHDGSYPLHFVLSHKCCGPEGNLPVARELVKILLEACPASAKHSMQGGRLALHAALENGWPCHDLLLAVHPEALDIPDPKTGLFPFQSAALFDWNRDPNAVLDDKKAAPATVSPALQFCDLDVTYELLRANPTYASQHVASKLTQVRAQA
jgi:hypothetical protein